MPGTLAHSFSRMEVVTIGLLALGVPLGAVWGYRLWRNSRISPEEIERRRRTALIASGKMGDANLVEIRDHLVFYSYDVRGVEYTASQDISSLKQLIPANLWPAIGPVHVRYDAKNPANSIIVSEEWSGLRVTPPQN